MGPASCRAESDQASTLKGGRRALRPLTYDLIIVGGGILGAGIARDATLRGLKVALFEKEDFSSGTTGRSTRLIHGGLRYLRHYEFGLVYEALHERRVLLRIAPHLVKPLPFLMPVYKGQGHSLPLLWLAIATYDFMSPWRAVPHHRLLPSNHVLRLEPALRPAGLRGGFLFYDAQCRFPERLCLENVLDAAAHGALVRNHAEVVDFLREDGAVVGVRTRDTFTGAEEEHRSRFVINAAGPWLDEVDRLADPNLRPRLRRTKGIHLVVPRFSQHALIVETQAADRVVFAIPWGPYTLLGTTDTDYEGRNEEVQAEADDVEYLLNEARAVFHVKLDRRDVLFTTAGLRPLKRELGRSTAEISRGHEIFDHEAAGGPRNLLTIVGGKITTYRNIARDTVTYLSIRLGRRLDPCRTHRLPLPGGRLNASWEPFVQIVRTESQKLGVSAETADHLAEHYGSRAFEVLRRVHSDPKQGERLEPNRPWIRAEVGFACEKEMARTLADALLRRLPIGLSEGQGRGIVLEVAAEMARFLGWDAAREDAEVNDYLQTLEKMRVPGEPDSPVARPSPRREVTL